MGPTYDILGYKRMILDLHFGTFSADAIIDISVDEIAESMASVGIDSLLHFPRDHWGYRYIDGRTCPPHPNTPTDLFGKVHAALTSKGIRTIGYLSVHWDEVMARQFPDWTMRQPDGSPVRRMEGKGDMDGVEARWTYLCLKSPYYDYLLAHVKELVYTYDFPALFVDIINEQIGRDVLEGCHCRYCRKMWKARYRYPMPTLMTDRERILWRDLYSEVQNEFYADVKTIILKSGKEVMTTHNRSQPYDHDDYVVFESEPSGQDYFRPSRLAKFYRAYANGREIESICYRFNQPWDFTTKPLPTLEFEVATALAHNCAISFVDQPLLRGGLDPKTYEMLAKAFMVADEMAPHIRGTEPYAELALLASDRSGDMLKQTQTDFAGAYCILTESHMPFDVLADSLVMETDLSRFKVIIVANTVHMKPEVVVALRRYVSDGGTLLFTDRSATLDFHGDPLEDASFGFVSIINESSHLVSFIKPMCPSTDSLIRVREAVRFQASAGVKVDATETPPALEVTQTQWITHNVMPGPDSDLPSVVTGECGKGRYIYIGPRIFREYIAQDLPSIREFIMGLINRYYQPSVWLDGPRAVEAVYQHNEGDLVITLINGLVDKPRAGGHNPIRDRGYVGMTETVPVAGLRLNLRGGRHVHALDLKGNSLPVSVRNNETSIEIARLDRYQLIRLSGFDLG